MKEYTSNFIFSLTDKYQIPLDDRPAEFLDETYHQFCQEYIELCKTRDNYLKQYLAANPKLFRTFLPWRAYIFETVFQTQWYYDELVIYDPIYFEITHFSTGNIEDNKLRLRQKLSFLNLLKESIKEGFLLFGSYDAFVSSNSKLQDNNFEALLSIPEIREECDKLVQVYKMEDIESQKSSYYNVRCFYRNRHTMFAVVDDFNKLKSEFGYGIFFDLVGSNYTPLSFEEVKSNGIYDRVYNGFKEDYPIEIKEILDYIDIGASIKTPVLFNRKLDELVLENISVQQAKSKSKATDYYQLFLPFVKDIPADRLLDVRMKMPSAFLDFRNLMFEIIYDFEKNKVDADILELKIQQKISPLLKKLDSEMKNSVTKAKIMGVGLPIVTSVGVLGLWSSGIDISKYVTLLLGGINIASASSVTNYLTEQRTGQANSLYYLWKVNKEK